MKVGYCEYGPSNGIGPFRDLFDTAVNLKYQPSIGDVDAVLLWGGEDISPSLYNGDFFTHTGPLKPSPRDLFEWEVMRQAHAKQIPIIGVCRGAQIICAFAGGKLIQHVTGHLSNHDITTYDGQILYVTSSHHQMLYPYDVEHELLAWSSKHRSTVYQPHNFMSDSLMARTVLEPEIVYFPEVKGFAIQSHPEWQGNGEGTWQFIKDEIMDKCFKKECC